MGRMAGGGDDRCTVVVQRPNLNRISQAPPGDQDGRLNNDATRHL